MSCAVSSGGEMSDGNPIVGMRKLRKLTRTLLIVNFVLLLFLIGPGSSRKLYLAERRLGIAHTITYSLQFWFIASTILSLVLFIWILVSRSERCRAQRPTGLDWALFLGWFLVATFFCLFAFMLGLGG
jgi:hypothetical protein